MLHFIQFWLDSIFSVKYTIYYDEFTQLAYNEYWKPQLITTYVPNNACAISKCLCSLDIENKGPSLLKTDTAAIMSTNASELANDEVNAH